jgi:hypothetical protein
MSADVNQHQRSIFGIDCSNTTDTKDFFARGEVNNLWCRLT